MKIFSIDRLNDAPLIVDAIYEGGSVGNVADDPISKLFAGAGNQGGFRAAGRGEDKRIVVLYTSGADKDWPDSLDLATGQFVYYGDNKTPGHELHDTGRGGNLILRRVFELLHGPVPERNLIPPFFVFQRHPTPSSSRSVQFKGLAVPGFPGIPATSDLVAIWKSTAGQRFQNYRSTFTILDIPSIGREWIDARVGGKQCSHLAPMAWNEWVHARKYRPLVAEPTRVIRTAEEQTPSSPTSLAVLRTVWMHFKDSPIAFEAFAARVFQMHDPRVIIDEITRGSIDGGRDAFGRYLLGHKEDPVYAEFSLEAKCYSPALAGVCPNSVGVKEVSRLISRIRHRQFGVLVTTSFVARQAYEEVRDDRHPIVFFSGKDIAETLIRSGFNTPATVSELLGSEFAVATASNL